MTRLVELIYTETTAGNGEGGSPFRRVIELWTKDGKLCAQYDAWSGGESFVVGGTISELIR